jgi:hypothetical protein
VVQRKTKEKEKDIPEKTVIDKRAKEKDREIFKRTEKVAEKIRDLFAPVATPLLPGPGSSTPAAVQREAFIRAEERPPVGESVLNPAIEAAPEVEPATPAPSDEAGASSEPRRKPPEKPLSAEKGAEHLADRLVP